MLGHIAPNASGRPPRSSVRTGRKPPTAESPSPLIISLVPCLRYPLRRRYQTGVSPVNSSKEESLSSTRSSSASSKQLKRSSSGNAEQRHLGKEMPICSAAAWAISNGKTGELLIGSQENSPREIASLTKIMTCYLCLQILRNIDELSLDSVVQVSQRAAHMAGTSAGLRPGDNLRVRDLLYGLMLPSGNDAAQCLSEYFGYHLALRTGSDPTSRLDRCFVREMNELSDVLQLDQTFFQNPHGMSTNKNLSTAKDVNTLASVAMKNSTFRNIVNARNYSCVVENEGENRVLTWENTNKLLQKGFEGVKTGSTTAAGPCLCVGFRGGEKRILITVLGSKTMEERWEEVPRMAKWVLERPELGKKEDI